MTALDKTLGKVAVKVIAKYGSPITFKSITTGSYNPSTGTTATTKTTATVKAIVEDYSLVNSGTGFQTGLIKAGDKKFTVAAAGITKPKPGDIITMNNVVYQIVRVVETWSGEEIALYELQARV